MFSTANLLKAFINVHTEVVEQMFFPVPALRGRLQRELAVFHSGCSRLFLSTCFHTPNTVSSCSCSKERPKTAHELLNIWLSCSRAFLSLFIQVYAHIDMEPHVTSSVHSPLYPGL